MDLRKFYPGKLYDITVVQGYNQYFYYIKKTGKKHYGVQILRKEQMTLIGNYQLGLRNIKETELTEARMKMIVKGIWDT